jgi:hypothetical protein
MIGRSLKPLLRLALKWDMLSKQIKLQLLIHSFCYKIQIRLLSIILPNSDSSFIIMRPFFWIVTKYYSGKKSIEPQERNFASESIKWVLNDSTKLFHLKCYHNWWRIDEQMQTAFNQEHLPFSSIKKVH